jgi:hypothetical protein
MSHKFTSDGRKVAIIGALNAKETIVQEIFVTDGTEFPAGEHFVVKTLLDTPAETYKAKEEARLTASIEQLKKRQELLSNEVNQFSRVSKAAFDAKIKWIKGIWPEEVETVMDNVKSMLCGEYTHILWQNYSSLEITEWGPDSFVSVDHRSFDGIKMISLFGEWNGRLELGWRMNSYRDGSGGSWYKFVPCRSIEEAVTAASNIINAKEYLSDNDLKFCLKYEISVDAVKNADRIKKKREYKEKEILATKERLSAQEADLLAIG